jgi:hypothetical protein
MLAVEEDAQRQEEEKGQEEDVNHYTATSVYLPLSSSRCF